VVETTAAGTQGFRLGLGQPVLDFLATLAGRRGEPLERLATPDDLSRWLDLTGLAFDARCDQKLLAQARELREALYRTVVAAREGRPPDAADLELVNGWARRRTQSPQLDTLFRVTLVGPDPCRAALAELAQAGIELVAGEQLPLIRNCANPGCSLMFIDHSRPGRRRWCSMERCGNRAKTARYRQRRARARDRRAGGRCRVPAGVSQPPCYSVARARSIACAAVIRPMWLNACGKFPSCSPVAVSISSPSRPRSFA
jgi:predicted RNA-binding Zn ribbon-like protein